MPKVNTEMWRKVLTPRAYCRCCGDPVFTFDGHPIHTKCIPKHWDRHAKKINASRCHEFGKRNLFGLCSVCARPFSVLSGGVTGCAVHGIRAAL